MVTPLVLLGLCEPTLRARITRAAQVVASPLARHERTVRASPGCRLQGRQHGIFTKAIFWGHNGFLTLNGTLKGGDSKAYFSEFSWQLIPQI